MCEEEVLALAARAGCARLSRARFAWRLECRDEHRAEREDEDVLVRDVVVFDALSQL